MQLPPPVLKAAGSIAEEFALLRHMLSALITNPPIPESPISSLAQARNAFAEPHGSRVCPCYHEVASMCPCCPEATCMHAWHPSSCKVAEKEAVAGR